MKLIYLSLSFSLILFSCSTDKPVEDALLRPEVDNKFQDEEIVRIFSLVEERNAEKLAEYLESENPLYRMEAAIGFASIQDTNYLANLYPLLKDSDPYVRISVAYALGQTQSYHSVDTIINTIINDSIPDIKAELLEALGKVANEKGMEYLINYRPTSAVAENGKIWGIYRATVRGLLKEEHLPIVVAHLEADLSDTRLAAAHSLNRQKEFMLNDYKELLDEVATSDSSAEVRIAATAALRHTDQNGQTLLNILQKDPDHRVRIAALSAMQADDYSLVSNAVFSALDDGYATVGYTAAGFFQDSIAPTDLQKIRNKAFIMESKMVGAALIKALLSDSAATEDDVNRTKELLGASDDPYQQGMLLNALAVKMENMELIKEYAFAGNTIVGTYAAEALCYLYQNNTIDDKDAFKNSVDSAFSKLNQSQIAVYASCLQDVKTDWPIFESHTFMKDAQAKLELPGDVEIYNEIEKALGILTGDEINLLHPKSNHPTNWNFVKTIKKDQRVTVFTEKGNFDMLLLVEDAPASVSNFIDLIRQDFYTDKTFHRIVPNFVAQAGCSRGDGWGSVDYTISSEFAPLHYGTGVVGYASAGKDTEGCQWFTTLSPAPHLDGKYSIFAAVTNGMETIWHLEIGDKIDSVRVY